MNHKPTRFGCKPPPKTQQPHKTPTAKLSKNKQQQTAENNKIKEIPTLRNKRKM
jgi:hypothetical protein